MAPFHWLLDRRLGRRLSSRDAEMLFRANFGKGALSKFGLNFDGRDCKPVPSSENDPDLQQTTTCDDSRNKAADEIEDDAQLMGECEDMGEEQETMAPPASRFVPEFQQEIKAQMSRRRYEKHRQWRKDVLRAEGLPEDHGFREDTDGKSDRGELGCKEGNYDEVSRDVEPETKRARLDLKLANENLNFADHKNHPQDDQGYSLGNSSTGDFLIYEDTDSEGEEDQTDFGRGDVAFASSGPKKFLFSRGEDPFDLKECLVLSFEEAFFLSYGLGCLTVMSSSPVDMSASVPNVAYSNSTSSSCSSSSSPYPLPLLELWRRFRVADPRFPSKYVAYHYYRSRGWVPRCGLKFGVDFLLYVYGPKDYHATFSLQVQEVDHRLHPVHHSRESASAASSAALSRVTEQVNKDLLICYVVRPKIPSKLAKRKTDDGAAASVKIDLKEPSAGSIAPAAQKDTLEVDPQADNDDLDAFLNSPNCVKKFRVKEVLKKRWIMDTERDQTKGLLLSMK